MRPSLEVADIFRAAGPAYRIVDAGHLSLDKLKVMSAIKHCRTAVMGGHTEACTDCGLWRVAYKSCRNRHCPRCQGAAARTPFILVAAYGIGRWTLAIGTSPVGRPVADAATGWLQWLWEMGPATMTGLAIIAGVGAVLGYVVSALGWRLWIGRKWRHRHDK